MMEKLRKRGVAIAKQRADKVKSEVKSALVAELPDHVSVDDTADDIIVRSSRLGQELFDNSSLRDVAFLMRGVR